MLALPVLCGLALTAGCSSSSSSSSASAGTSTTAPPASASATAPSTDAALCADAAALRTSLNDLIHVNVGSGAASQITTNLNNVRTALSTLVSNAHGQLQPQTSALNTALKQMTSSAFDTSLAYEMYTMTMNDFKEATSAFVGKRKGNYRGN